MKGLEPDPRGLPGPAGLRAPGRVLLISTYELGHQPLGLASPLGFLGRAGYQAAALDLAAEPLDPAAVARAGFIGFSVPMHTAMRIALAAAERVRAQNPVAHICFYGLYAPLQHALLRSPHASGRPLADSVLGGEYEEALLHRIAAVEQRARPSSSSLSPSLPPSPPLPRLALDAAPPPVLRRLPFAQPARESLLPLDGYARLLRDGERLVAGYTEATRGCLHRCTHCPIPAVYDGRFFAVPVEIVLGDVRRQVEAGARHITLGDPDFLNGPGHALAVARAIHREFPSLSFDATIKIEHILRRAEIFPELSALGCLFVTTAVESLSDRVLGILDKGHSRSDVEEAIRIVRAAGIGLRPTWVPFTPWSTLEEHLALLTFLEDEALLDAVDPVQLIIRLLVPPGSLLLSHPAMLPHLGALDDKSLSYRWTHPDPRMDALQKTSAARVAEGEARGEEAEVTYHALKRLAWAAAGRPDEPPHVRFPTEGAPKLSESWFC